jgi:hypothetical protein
MASRIIATQVSPITTGLMNDCAKRRIAVLKGVSFMAAF